MKYLDIKLPALDPKGKETLISIGNLHGKNIVVYFYPQDDTPICTIEAVDFRDKLKEFPKDTVIIGVSPDSLLSHKLFFAKHHLNFYLASDKEYKLAKSFNNLEIEPLTNMYGLSRSTFIINKDGKLIKEMRDIDIKGHIEEVISCIKDITK